MSKFSGKCDLADHIMMLSNDQNNGDLLDCFEKFKERTGGVIHQHIRIKKVASYNREFIKNNCEHFDYKEHIRELPDKRQKSGNKIEKYYTYTYYNMEYTEKEINKKGVYITKNIEFNTLLDLIPYFPYIISCAICNNDKETIYISDQSFVEEEENAHLQYGYTSQIPTLYRKALSDLYLEVCRDYFLKDLENRTKKIKINLTDLIKVNENYELNVPSVDYMHEPKFIITNKEHFSCWDSPKVKDDTTIIISNKDVEEYLKDDLLANSVYIEYVEKLER